MNSNSIRYRLRRKRIIFFNWEYWSFNVLYLPVYFYWLWLSIRARSFFFFSTSNPGIENGGFIMERKKAIYDILPSAFYPKTVLIPVAASAEDIEALLSAQQFCFPLAAKPDIGERGNAVKKVNNTREVLLYQQQSSVDFLLQEWCDYNNEIGVFYCRYPDQQKGFITGIVRKEFMTVTGNGSSTIEELILQNDRYFLQHQTLLRQQPQALQQIPGNCEELVVVPYGNHCRGTKFIDDSDKIDDQLTAAFNHICTQIPGFYFGRLDIRFESWDLLKQAKNFSIIELNGAGSEPTHMYDPRHSVFFAWREIIKHLSILFTLSRKNKKRYNLSYLSFRAGVSLFRDKKEYSKRINLDV